MAQLNVLNDYNERASVANDNKKLENYDLLTIKKSHWVVKDYNCETDLGIICSAPLTERPSFKVSPKYTTFGQVGTNLEKQVPGAQFFQTMRNVSTWQTMSMKRESPFGNISTAKLFQGAGDMSWTFKFRMFEGLDKESKRVSEYDPMGESLSPLYWLLPLCIPKLSKETMTNINDLFENLSSPAWNSRILGALGAAVNAIGQEVGGALKGVNDMVKTAFKQSTGNEDFRYPSDQFAWRTENCIDIRVSNVMNLENLVIDSFDATFSREVLESGLPVYTDYTLSVSPIVQPCLDEVSYGWLGDFMKNDEKLQERFRNTLTGSLFMEGLKADRKRMEEAANSQGNPAPADNTRTN